MVENPPAYPRNYNADGHNGMSLRDWFAGQAMMGAFASGTPIPFADREEWARTFYAHADAMLAERSRT